MAAPWTEATSKESEECAHPFQPLSSIELALIMQLEIEKERELFHFLREIKRSTFFPSFFFLITFAIRRIRIIFFFFDSVRIYFENIPYILERLPLVLVLRQ